MKRILWFPKAVSPPQLKKPFAPLLGWIAATLLACFAVVHLFRIDTLVPTFDNYLEGPAVVAGCLVALLVTIEVFAIPFALRMKLSPLAHRVSGFFLVLAPLTWLLLSIWTYGVHASTGQLGKFLPVFSNVGVVGLNALWLIFSFYTAWALGYGSYKIPRLGKLLSK